MVSAETQDLARRAEAIYEQRLRAELEKSHPDWFVAIEPDSGDYFLGRTLSEAGWAGYQARPDRRKYIIRIGHLVAVEIGNSPRLKSDLYDDSPWTDDEMAQLAAEDADRLGWEGMEFYA